MGMNAMKKRKPILLVDDSLLSQRIRKLFCDSEVDFTEYHIKKFGESCCGELPTTKAPAVIASEGIYKEEENIKNYIRHLKENQNKLKLQQEQQVKGSNDNNQRIEKSQSDYS
jgi:hypothetical protein